MIEKELIIKKVGKIEDRIFVSKVLDKLFKAQNTNTVSYSDFLDPHQRLLVDRALAGSKDIDYTFYGGYVGAERTIVIFRPNFMSSDDELFQDGETGNPLKVLSIGSNQWTSLSHRDYLGSIMGLGIKREKVGDILVRENSCSVVVFADIADYIKYNLNKVANSKVKIDIGDVDNLVTVESDTKEIKTTVASLRLDTIASAGFGISRSKMAEYIRAERVNLNWETESSLTKQIKEGDTISIRGKGRIILDTIGMTTKKGRIGITLKKLI